MTDGTSVRLPGEDPAYRTARNELLEAERDLRRRIERVAELRRALPPGGPLKEDYAFLEASPRRETGPTRFSALFEAGKDSLVIYGFMYAEGGSPCPMCSAFLDSLDGAAPHIGQVVNLAVVAKASPGELRDWAARRGWRNLRLLSSSGTRYNADYLAENAQEDRGQGRSDKKLPHNDPGNSEIHFSMPPALKTPLPSVRAGGWWRMR